MSSSHRRENPSRSAAEPSSRHRNYRFKSYLEANTQERARFDSMQDHVPDKIAEVIASFREEKLTVHPHRPQVAGAAADVGQRVDMPRPRPRPRSVAVAPAVAGRRRPAWHWYLGALGLAFALMIWLDTRADVDRAPALPLVASNSGSELTTTPGYDTSTHVDAAAMSGGMSTGSITAAPASVVVPLERTAKPAPAPVRMAAAPQRKKPAPTKVRNTKDEVHHYSEDLTGLLQGP